VRFRVERSWLTEAVDHDRGGQPITNSVGEVLDPPLTRYTIEKILVAEWLKYGLSWEDVYALLAPYEGKINSAAYPSRWGSKAVASYSLLCMPFEIEPADVPLVSTPADRWWRVQARCLYRASKTLFDVEYAGWDDVFLNRGRHQGPPIPLGGGAVDWPLITLADKTTPISEPVLISIDGTPLPPDAKPVVGLVEHYDEIDFNTFLPAEAQP
jgi:hypothetical protein